MTGYTPAVIPVTKPVVDPIVAVVPVELHVPPGLASVSVIEPPPAHTPVEPEITAGRGTTVTTAVATQPEPTE